MNKTYRISNDGTIFEIKDDGSIGKLAKLMIMDVSAHYLVKL